MATKKKKTSTTTSGGNGVHPKKLIKGYLVNEDTNDVLKFQFNPSEWYTEHGATYNEIESPGSKYPAIFYSGRKLERIQLTLYFYGVKNIVGKKSSKNIEDYFVKLVKPKKKQKKFIKGSNHFISPPICTFVFGKRCYETVVENVKVIRKMFNYKLQTMQLEVNVQLIVVKR